MTVAGRAAITVRGPVDPADLGITLAHEHLWMDSTPLLAIHGYRAGKTARWGKEVAAEARWNPGIHPDNYRLTDVDATVEELKPFTAAGGRTVVEMTPPTLGRDPSRVREIAERSGVHVVQGTGQYVEPLHEAWVADASVSVVAARLCADAETGIAETGIRAGIYGEIGTSDPLRPGEAKVLRAVGAAARGTGLAISVHLQPWGHEGRAVLEMLLSAGANPRRVILGHVSTAIDRPDELRALLDRGVVLGFDLFGFDHTLLGPGRWPPSDRDVAAAIVALLGAGYRESIVLGQDVGYVVPVLRELGAGDQDLDAMLVHLRRHRSQPTVSNFRRP